MIFTPANIVKNCTFDIRACSVNPDNNGNQCVNAAKIANTAPILST